MDIDIIFKSWEQGLKKKPVSDKNTLNHRMKTFDDHVKEQPEKTQIWLGGPGNSDKDHSLRVLIRRLLEGENFVVNFSEDFQDPLSYDLAEREIKEARLCDMVIIIAMSPGSITEAIEFCHDHEISKKLYVFIPDQFRNGFAYKSLRVRHQKIQNEFDLDKFRAGDCFLASCIIECANNHRTQNYISMNVEKKNSINLGPIAE